MTHQRTHSLAALLTYVAAALAPAAAPACAAQEPTGLAVHPAMASGAVWQQGPAFRLLGRAAPGETVALYGQPADAVIARATSDADGRFALEPSQLLKPGGPYAFALASASERIELTDIYVGDVILLSGQSNMEWAVADANEAQAAIAHRDPMLRHFKVARTPADEPLDWPETELDWQPASPDYTGRFSAVGYYLARTLRQRDPSVPVGLVNATWGGSRIEAWMPRGAAGAEPTYSYSPETRARWAQLRRDYPEAFKADPLKDLPVVEAKKLPRGEATPVGEAWERNAYPNIDGVIWYLRSIELDGADLAGDSLTIALGSIDDSDESFLDGKLIGRTIDQYAAQRRYRVASSSLRAGEHELAVRVSDNGWGGGLQGPPDSLFVRTAARRISLADGWRSGPQAITLDTVPRPNHRPTLLYNGMLAPLAGLPVGAVAWYQGESNTGSIAEAEAYAGQLRTLVGTFRELLTGESPIPFVAVELPEFTAEATRAYEPQDTWPVLRGGIAGVRALPAATSVPTLGLGDAADIHPRRKREVGERVAEALRQLRSGTLDAPRATMARGLSTEGRRLTVRFADVGTGLRSGDGGALRGFAVQLPGGAWVPAEARIVSPDRVLLSYDAELAPEDITAVAYAWANNPGPVSLVNGWGWPVSSFRVSALE